MPCPGGRVYLKRSSRTVPEASVYLADRTRRTVVGAQLNPAGGPQGPCTALPTAASAIQPPSAADGIRSSVSGDLRVPNKPGRCCRCRPDGQPERTRDVKKLNLLLSEIVDDKTPHTPDTNFYVVSRTRVLGSDPGEDNERRIGDLVV